jgi:hypothetical protein
MTRKAQVLDFVVFHLSSRYSGQARRWKRFKESEEEVT